MNTMFQLHSNRFIARQNQWNVIHRLGAWLLLPLLFFVDPGKLAAWTGPKIPALDGKVLLTIEGNIENHNVGETLQFDLAMLESFNPVTFTTETIWLNEATTFTGVRLSEILNYAEASSDTIRADALDKYWYEFKNDSWKDIPVIIAYKKNGSYMRIKDLGPLWIMYPFDQYPDTLTEENQSACVWQLARLTVL